MLVNVESLGTETSNFIMITRCPIAIEAGGAINRVSIIGNRDKVKKKLESSSINFDSSCRHWLKKCKYKCPPRLSPSLLFTRLSPDFTAPLKLTIKRAPINITHRYCCRLFTNDILYTLYDFTYRNGYVYTISGFPRDNVTR